MSIKGQTTCQQVPIRYSSSSELSDYTLSPLICFSVIRTSSIKTTSRITEKHITNSRPSLEFSLNRIFSIERASRSTEEQITNSKPSLALESLELRSRSDHSDLLTDCPNLFALESNPQLFSTKRLSSSFVIKLLPTFGFARPSDA